MTWGVLDGKDWVLLLTLSALQPLTKTAGGQLAALAVVAAGGRKITVVAVSSAASAGRPFQAPTLAESLHRGPMLQNATTPRIRPRARLPPSQSLTALQLPSPASHQ